MPNLFSDKSLILKSPLFIIALSTTFEVNFLPFKSISIFCPSFIFTDTP